MGLVVAGVGVCVDGKGQHGWVCFGGMEGGGGVGVQSWVNIYQTIIVMGRNGTGNFNESGSEMLNVLQTLVKFVFKCTQGEKIVAWVSHN